MKKITWKKYNEKLCEIDQTPPVKYAFLDNDLVSLHKEVKCKDFLLDIFWSELKNQEILQYGFVWKPNGEILKQNPLILGLKCQNLLLGIRTKNLQRLISEFDKVLGFKATAFTSCNQRKCVIVKFDKKWSETPYLLSLFTLLLRVGLFYNGKDVKKFFEEDYKTSKLNNNDQIYILGNNKKILHILNRGELPKQTYEQYLNVGSCHSNSGIVSTSFESVYKEENVKINKIKESVTSEDSILCNS